MKKNVSIKVIADVICPWCFIGCSYLNKSMLKRDNIIFKIDWQTYYLNPSMPYLGMDRKRYLKNKFGNQANIVESQIISTANNSKIEINLEKISITPNTRKIHQTINLLKKEKNNKSYQLAYKFMRDYFINGIDLRNDEYISKSYLYYNSSKNKDFKNETNYLDGHQPFLTFDFMSGVPVFIFNDRWTIHGAQSSKILETAIDIAAND